MPYSNGGMKAVLKLLQPVVPTTATNFDLRTQALEACAKAENMGPTWEHATEQMSNEYKLSVLKQHVEAMRCRGQHRGVLNQLSTATDEMYKRHDDYITAKCQSLQITKEANRLRQESRFRIFDWNKPLTV